MGARTVAAKAEVVARRRLLRDEVVKLEAAGRSAVDIPAKIRRAPAKTAALVGGSAFLLLRGPKRLYRGARRLVLGPDANLPKSMLPEEIDKALSSLGSDGRRVRGVIEREFASYLDESRPRREARDLRGTISELGGTVLKPITAAAGKRLARELLRPDGESFSAAVERIRRRGSSGSGGEAGAASSGGAEAGRKASRWEKRPGRRNILRPR